MSGAEPALSIDAAEAQAAKPEADPLDFFNSVYDATQRAKRVVGETLDRYYEIGNATIRLRFVGRELIPLVNPALEHLASPKRDADLTVWILDSASTGVSMPPAPWRMQDVTRRGDIPAFTNNRIATVLQPDATLLSLLDVERRIAIYWIRDARDMPLYERAAPLLRIIHWWQRSRGLQVVHGAAVGTPSGGVLLAGKSGSGKSTTALACVHAGLGYVADDYCLLGAQPVPTVFSLYNSAKTHAHDLDRLPFVAPFVSNAEHLATEKALYFFQRHLPDRLLREFPLRAILIPRVTGARETILSAAPPSAGVVSLAPSTLSQLPGSNRETIEIIAAVCRLVPVFYLQLGTEMSEIPRVISNLLTRG